MTKPTEKQISRVPYCINGEVIGMIVHRRAVPGSQLPVATAMFGTEWYEALDILGQRVTESNCRKLCQDALRKRAVEIEHRMMLLNLREDVHMGSCR